MLRLILTMGTGALVSVRIFFLTLIFSIPLALPIALGRMSKIAIIRVPVNILMLILRGTPLMLQLIFVGFAPYYIFGVSMDRFAAVIIAFAINYAAYFAEIYRGGIESIPAGQREAAKILGFTKSQAFFRIILPQTVKRILPACGNEVITLVKDTALAQVLTIAELFHVAQNSAARMDSTIPLFVAGAFYFVMNYAVAGVFDFAEKKLDYYR